MKDKMVIKCVWFSLCRIILYPHPKAYAQPVKSTAAPLTTVWTLRNAKWRRRTV